MTPGVAGLVLFAALMHAVWNAVLKGGNDRLRSVTLMTAACAAVSAVGVLVLPAPRVESWAYIAVSAALHVVYNLLLVISYRHGDLGVAYPIARGSAPLLVTVGAAVFARERPDLVTWGGVCLISLGIVALARENRGGVPAKSLIATLLTGVTIAAYTLVDGLGGRLSGNPQSYTAWLFLAFGPPMIAILFARRGRAGVLRIDVESFRAAGGGLVSMIAYGIVIWAATVSPMGQVSALRETSVVFAATLGWLFLGERLGRWRLGACVVVAVGGGCLGYQRN